MTTVTKIDKQEQINQAIETIKALDDDTIQVSVKIEYKNDVPQKFIWSDKKHLQQLYDKQINDQQDNCFITNEEGIATTQVIQELDDGTIRAYELVEFEDIYFENPNGIYPEHKGDNTIRTLRLSGKYTDHAKVDKSITNIFI